MIQLPWIFAGFIVGLVIVSVFKPVPQILPSVPEPNDVHVYKTASGCVRVRSIQVPCTSDAIALNILAEQHK
jgi:hypothetical protein